jgi:hypothetical protein
LLAVKLRALNVRWNLSINNQSSLLLGVCPTVLSGEYDPKLVFLQIDTSTPKLIVMSMNKQEGNIELTLPMLVGCIPVRGQ